MDTTRDSSASPLKILLLVFGIVGVVGLVIVLACGGLIYLAWGKIVPQFQALQTSADAFVQDIHAGQLQSAYERTSAGFQASQTFAQFQGFAALYPALNNYTSRTCNGVHISSSTGAGTEATVRYTVVGPNNSLTFTLILVQENERWRVDRFTVP